VIHRGLIDKGRCALACETVEKGLKSADFPPSHKFLPRSHLIRKIT
jgi:hypothetical protein